MTFWGNVRMGGHGLWRNVDPDEYGTPDSPDLYPATAPPHDPCECEALCTCEEAA